MVTAMKNDTAHRVAGTVRAELARRKVTGQALAAKLGISQSALSRRLNGDIPLDVNELAAIAELLDIDPRELLAEAA